jgi:hypothetical protein
VTTYTLSPCSHRPPVLSYLHIATCNVIRYEPALVPVLLHNKMLSRGRVHTVKICTGSECWSDDALFKHQSQALVGVPLLGWRHSFQNVVCQVITRLLFAQGATRGVPVVLPPEDPGSVMPAAVCVMPVGCFEMRPSLTAQARASLRPVVAMDQCRVLM